MTLLLEKADKTSQKEIVEKVKTIRDELHRYDKSSGDISSLVPSDTIYLRNQVAVINAIQPQQYTPEINLTIISYNPKLKEFLPHE